MVTADEVRAVVLPLPRSYEVFVYGRRKFRVGQIVYLAFSRDETTIGLAFPKEWRAIVVEAEAHKFMLPSASDMRFNWLHARLEALDATEMHDLVMDAWRMVVPKRVAAEWDARTVASLRDRVGRRRRLTLDGPGGESGDHEALPEHVKKGQG
jgi:hypothetical protein